VNSWYDYSFDLKFWWKQELIHASFCTKFQNFSIFRHQHVVIFRSKHLIHRLNNSMFPSIEKKNIFKVVIVYWFPLSGENMVSKVSNILGDSSLRSISVNSFLMKTNFEIYSITRKIISLFDESVAEIFNFLYTSNNSWDIV
jgi:hypothetical protein